MGREGVCRFGSEVSTPAGDAAALAHLEQLGGLLSGGLFILGSLLRLQGGLLLFLCLLRRQGLFFLLRTRGSSTRRESWDGTFAQARETIGTREVTK